MALARLLRERKISCRELIDRYICRIERLNPLLNAYVFTAAKQSYKQAERAQKMIDGGCGDILCGIPVAVKDNICTDGVPTTCCSKILQGHVPLYSAYAVHRLEERGAIINPKRKIAEGALAAARSLAAEFGMTPSSRNRVAALLANNTSKNDFAEFEEITVTGDE